LRLGVVADQDAIRAKVGYCPQHDALEYLMTGRETLRMYANIKRVPSHEIEAEVQVGKPPLPR
jgi:ABC-type multidrug transport system ATPase subunit